MFYPLKLDLGDPTKIQRATVILNPAASKRLIGKAVAGLPEVQNAFKNGRLSVSTSSTSNFVLQELTGETLPTHAYCVGMVANGWLTSSSTEDRELPRYFLKGEVVTEPDALKWFDTFEAGDCVIKGANALDPCGNVGVLCANKQGGTVGALLSFLAVRGIPLVMAVGLEKSVASVTAAADGWGQLSVSKSMGLATWLFPVTCGLVVTEIQALGLLAGVHVRHIGSGGISGSEGAVVLLLEGSEKALEKAWDLVQSVKDEPPLMVPRHQFSC